MPDRAMHHERSAHTYDDWWLGRGIHTAQPRRGWSEDVERLTAKLAGLEPARVLHGPCGTGLLTQQLSGFVVGLDQSPAMVELAQRRLPSGLAVRGDPLALPSPTAASTA